ncbi:MAG: glycosyltransferase family 2 protein [Opitutaceae bacterium]
MDSALVSILIPAHNAAPWIRETLASALAQTWPRTEIVVVDDGSTDGTAEAVGTRLCAGVRLIRQENRGAAAARNTAFAAARGDWIQHLDADDLLAPDKIERQMTAAQAAPQFAFAGDWSRFERAPAVPPYPPEILCRDADPVSWVVEKLERHAMMHPAAWLLARSLAERVGPWDETLTLDDDGEYFTRAVLASAGVRHCPGAVSHYRSHLPGSLSRSGGDRAWASAFRSLELTAGGLLAREDSVRTRHACATAFQRFIYEAYPRAASSRRRAAARVKQWGGSDAQPLGGPRFQRARRLLGWRLAKRLLLAQAGESRR